MIRPNQYPGQGSLRNGAHGGMQSVDRSEGSVWLRSIGRTSAGASILETLRDANAGLWPAEPAAALSSTEATTVASITRAGGQMGEGVDPNERVRPVGGAGQGVEQEVFTRGKADRSAATVRKASRIACRMASSCANVNVFCPDAILARDSFSRLHPGSAKHAPGRVRPARLGLRSTHANGAAFGERGKW